ncbi:MAG: DNA topoisomerase (ATP-hydrolyzing) subunit A [Defluviitaleaceae bacterium]|nr:DNA topoisomerase (ATP-hydrolyzing) subunit A [Defluviitaleaceae bacterium]
MSKRKKNENITVYEEAPPIMQGIVQTLESNYMPYAMSVIVSRAIPEIDGFKPAHRKLLYTMYKMGLLTGNRMKSADVVGTTMRLNPHGEGAIYETLVRLTRGNESLLHPFIDSKGNFGKSYSRDMAYAASRYTEVKLSTICNEIFKDIDKNTVSFVDNYNGAMQEPVLLPSTFANVLVTPNVGIAVGMASNICSFNLIEVCEAVVELIKTGHVQKPLVPDFSTGAELLYNADEMAKINETGRGSFKMRSVWNFDTKNNCIEVTQIPYTTTIEAIIDKIHALVKSGKMRDITDVRDETDLKGLKIAIDIKKSSDPEQLMQRLFAATPLMDSFSCNFNLLIDGRPATLGVKDILTHWIDFRKNCILGRLNFDLEKNKEKLHLLEGLAKILLDIDKAIAIIRGSKRERDVIPNLCAGFEIDKVQAEYIAEIRLRNLNQEYLLKRVGEKDALNKEIEKTIDILGDHAKVLNIISSEQKEIIKKHGIERKTVIVEAAPLDIKPQVFVENYPVVLYLTQENYFKKIHTTPLRSNPTIYVKEDDHIIQQIPAQNTDDVLFFSNKHNVYKAKAHELEDNRPSQLGTYLNNILPCDDDEKIIFVASTADYSGHLFFAFQNGKAAMVTLASYATQTNRKKLINAYSDKSPLVCIEFLSEHQDFLVTAKDPKKGEKSFVFSTELLPIYSAKNAGGVQFVKLGKTTIDYQLSVINSDITNIENLRADKLPASGFLTAQNEDAQLRIE